MTIEKLSSGSYRIRQTYKGKRYSVTVDHKPTQKEAMILIADIMNADVPAKGVRKSFEYCALEYIEDRENVLSQGTVKGYGTLIRSMSNEFKRINIYDITMVEIQREINRYSAEHSPKSVRNMNGFISAVMGVYREGMVINTSLPQKAVDRHHRPSEEDVKRILEASAGTIYHIPFQLGVLGLRRGEVCALTLDDLKGNELTICKDVIEDKNFHWVTKNMAKTSASNRTIQIPQKLADEIKASGKIFDLTPPMLVQTLHSYQERLGIERFRFHDLRSYCASYLHFLGYPDKYIQNYCGWASGYTMNKIYKEAMEDRQKDIQKEMADSLLG